MSLTKPRIVELLLVTTVPGDDAGRRRAGRTWDCSRWCWSAGHSRRGAASALNCYIDRDIDQLMRRTKRRPLPAHSVTPRAVLIFGLSLAVVSVMLMAAFTNWLATALTAAAIVYYDVVYTLWLKRRTPENTFWGGICGAAPVIIGWAAVTGSVALLALGAFRVVFFWQMPHFYALAIKYKDDYARAGIPMLPVVRSATRVNREILLFTVAHRGRLAGRLAARPGPGLRRHRGGRRRAVPGRGDPAGRALAPRWAAQADAAVPRVDHVPDDPVHRGRRGRAASD